MVESDYLSQGENTVIFRARVTVPTGGSATGWGHERAADFGDFLEKAEMKALGRALAALGYGTQFCEDFEFELAETRVGAGARVVDSPVDRGAARAFRVMSPGLTNVTETSDTTRPAQGASRGRGAPQATDAQLKAIYAIVQGTLALDDEELETRCRDRFGCAPQSLDRRQASEFIDALKLNVPAKVG